MDLTDAKAWIRAHVEPAGTMETAHERPWATVMRVPLADSVAWFRACGPVQAFEPRLSAELFARHPDRVVTPFWAASQQVIGGAANRLQTAEWISLKDRRHLPGSSVLHDRGGKR